MSCIYGTYATRAEDMRRCASQFDRRQGAQVVLVGHGRQAFENVLEVEERIPAGTADVLHHGVDDGTAVAGVRAADEQPVARTSARMSSEVRVRDRCEGANGGSGQAVRARDRAGQLRLRVAWCACDRDD